MQTPGGRPDIVFPGPKVSVFIDGCFWHGCPTHYVRPRSREEFWAGKLEATVLRDRRQTLVLEAAGWRVVRAWEHEVYEDLDAVLGHVGLALDDPSWAAQRSMRVLRVDPVSADGDTERRYLESLRSAVDSEEMIGPRTTRKWRRPGSL